MPCRTDHRGICNFKHFLLCQEDPLPQLLGQAALSLHLRHSGVLRIRCPQLSTFSQGMSECAHHRWQ